MRKLFLLFSLFITVTASSQEEFADTTFSVRNFTCHCKYNRNAEDDNKIVDRNAIAAYYPGGDQEWNKFVKKNIDKGFKGKHTVEVRFQVNRDGDLENFLLLNKVPNQKYEEVLRVLKLSGKWFPSIQNGYCLKSYVRLSFEL